MSNANLTAPTVLTYLRSATQQPAPRTHVPPLDHAMKAYTLQRNAVARAIGGSTATAQLLAFGIDAETWNQVLQMQVAALQRLHVLQQGWLKGWIAWTRYADQTKGANTMSKLVEREYNIVAQFTQLLTEQVTGLMELQENIEVGYSYWVAEKLHEKRKTLTLSTAG